MIDGPTAHTLYSAAAEAAGSDADQLRGLRRAAWKSYLFATAEMIDRAIGSQPALSLLRDAVREALSNLDTGGGAELPDFEIASLEQRLYADFERWAPGSAADPVLVQLLRDGWDGRTWLGVFAESFCAHRAAILAEMIEALPANRRSSLERAMPLLEERARLCRAIGDTQGLQECLARQARIRTAWGLLAQAIALHREEERLCRELGNWEGVQISLGNQAEILKQQGQLDQAMALLREQERICRELGMKAGLRHSLARQAENLTQWGRSSEAAGLAVEAERLWSEIAAEIGADAGPPGSGGAEIEVREGLRRQAQALLRQGRINDAMELIAEQERVCREGGDRLGLQDSLECQAGILYDGGDLHGVMAAYREVERIARSLDDLWGLERSLHGQALILEDWGQTGEAREVLDQREEIARELGLD